MSTLFRDKFISPNSFTYGWVYDQLVLEDIEFQLFISNYTIVDANSFDVSGGKGGFSEVFKITFVTNDNGPKYTTILKVPGSSVFENAINSSANVDDTGNTFKSSSEMQNAIVKMHNRECDFYTKFTFERIPIPKVFNATYWQPNIKQKGCLLMKDLSVDSKDVDFSESLNVSQAFQIAESISQLQVYSIINKEEIESLELFSPFKDVEFDEVVKKRIPTFITEYDNELGDEARQVLATAASDPQFEHFINTEACSRFDLPQVLSHADIWTNNIFFKKDKYGNATSELKCIMDWQLFIKSNPAHDLARFMVLSLDGDVRRKYSKSINQHYYNILSKELALKNHTVPFTFENYEKMYDYCYVHQAVQMLLMVSIFLTHTNFDKTEAQYKRGFTEKLILRTKHVLEDANICIQTMNGEWKE